MNYVHQNGGWKGIQPDWDTTAPVNQNSEVYAQQRRESAKNKIAELTARLQSLNVADDTAGVDRPAFVEVE
jgi:helicase MOV-10